MRLYIHLSENTEIIPFNYQHLLTGVVHKWLGANNMEHGSKSLYSFSWLQQTESSKNGIKLTKHSYFFISAYNADLIKRIIKGILESPDTFCGASVIDVQIKNTPDFSDEEKFFVSSPVLIRKREANKVRHVTYLDDDFESLLTENLKNKLSSVNLKAENITVEFDDSYAFSQTKLVNYKGIKNRTSFAPVIIKGTPEQIAFAWDVGLGNSTGIGFGALK